ncbi:MAG: hypothetical protein AAFP90_20055, partial [Planctomycetota bacterium]
WNHGHGTNQESARSSTATLARFINTASSRLGQALVLGVRCDENPLPESAYHYVPMTGGVLPSDTSSQGTGENASTPMEARTQQSRTTGQRWFGRQNLSPSNRNGPLRRPTQLMEPPLEIRVQTNPKDPQAIQTLGIGNVLHTAVYQWGPERIQTGWWSNGTIDRDYFRVETNNGVWLWVYLHRPSGKWYLQGKW